MKTLSELLQEHLGNQNLTPAALAKSCSIDRSTMFQYLHGKRPLKNPDHLNVIMDRLSLSIAERQDLLKAYQIELIGYELYSRREKMDQFIRSLPTLNERPNIFIKEMNENIPADISFQAGMAANHLEVSQAVFSLLCAAHRDNSSVRILMQPKASSLLNLLLHPAFAHSSMKVTHITCLDNHGKERSSQNIDKFSVLLRYFPMLDNYLPLYFYGNTEECFGFSNLFPYAVLTSHGVLQISENEEQAILHTDPDIIRAFHKAFDLIAKNCQQLGDAHMGLEREINWYSSFISKESFQDTYELCTGLCSIQFWDRPFIEAYLNPMIPNARELADYLLVFCQNLYQIKKAADTTVLMSPANVLEFIQTGRMKEYPDVFFSKPLEKKDRLHLLKQILKACEEGWYHICFIGEAGFPLEYRWEICANRESTMIQYFHLEQFQTFLLSEHEFVEGIYDYLVALSQSEHAMSEEDSLALLKSWINQYLS